MALQPFEGKVPPGKGEQKKAVIFWGPPGSGKTTRGTAQFEADYSDAERKKFVTVSYDEKGGIEAIPAYAEQKSALEKKWNAALAEAERIGRNGNLEELYNERLKLYRHYRDDSQRIRSTTFNEAVQRGHNLLIDITASGGGAVKMLDRLREQGYQIEFNGYIASSLVAEDRVFRRGVKVVESQEVYDKRVDALKTLPALIEKADKFSLYLNEHKSMEPLKVVTYEQGKLKSADQTALSMLTDVFDADVERFTQLKDAASTGKAQDLANAIASVEKAMRDTGVKPLWQEKITRAASQKKQHGV